MEKNEELGLLTPKERLDSLNAIANIQIGSTQYSCKVWCHTADKLDKQAEQFYQRKDIDNSYVGFMKFCNIVLEVLPKHPEFKELKKKNDPTLLRVRKRAVEVMEKLERLQKLIKGEPTSPWPEDEPKENIAPFRTKKGVDSIYDTFSNENNSQTTSSNFNEQTKSNPQLNLNQNSKLTSNSSQIPIQSNFNQISSSHQTQNQTQSQTQIQNPNQNQNSNSMPPPPYTPLPINEMKNTNNSQSNILPQQPNNTYSEKQPIINKPIESNKDKNNSLNSSPFSKNSESNLNQSQLPQFQGNSTTQNQNEEVLHSEILEEPEEKSETEKESKEDLSVIPELFSFFSFSKKTPKEPKEPKESKESKESTQGSFLSSFFKPKPQEIPVDTSPETKYQNSKLKDLESDEDFVIISQASDSELRLQELGKESAMIATIKKMHFQTPGNQASKDTKPQEQDQNQNQNQNQNQDQEQKLSLNQRLEELNTFDNFFEQHQSPREEGQKLQPTEEVQVLERAIALYHFSPATEEELPMEENQEVEILSSPDDHGWVQARINGKVGFVPYTYLQVITE